MKFQVSHKTVYQYGQPVVQSQLLLHLAPRAIGTQTTLSHGIFIDPAPAMRFDGVDAFGNPISILDIEEPHREIVLHSRSVVQTFAGPVWDLAQTTAWDRLDAVICNGGQECDLEVVEFRCASALTTATLDIHDYAAVSFLPGRPVLEAAFDLTSRIYREFLFDPAATDVSTPVTQVFENRRGVCQDFAHLALACLRAHRIPARYMSGYILTHPPPGQPKLYGSDASHAWISVWSPETGWVGFDPTNGLVVKDEHILVGFGRDYHDVSPVGGVILGGGAQAITVSVDVMAIA